MLTVGGVLCRAGRPPLCQLVGLGRIVRADYAGLVPAGLSGIVPVRCGIVPTGMRAQRVVRRHRAAWLAASCRSARGIRAAG
jgi:hypothetical protein